MSGWIWQRETTAIAMLKLLVRYCLFWSLVLFLAPVPALGNFNSGDCTVDNSPSSDGNLVTSVTPTCSNDSAAVEVVARSFDDIRNGDRRHASLLFRIDYICIGYDGQQIRGTPWTTDYRDRRIDVTNLDTFFDVKDENNPQFTATVQQSLPPGTNCTFYLCYRQRRTNSDQLGRTSPVSCVTELNECNIAYGGCEHRCTDTIESFFCSCNTGYQLDENGLNCNDIDECESSDLNNCHGNENCFNTEGSFICTNLRTTWMRVPAHLALNDTDECNTTNGGCEQVCIDILDGFFCSCHNGYLQNGSNCTDINECDTANGGCEHSCTNTIGSFTCSCHTGYQLDENGLNCSDVDECRNSTRCHENANCTNTEGSYSCSCNDGYSGSGTECTDIDECKMGSDNCDENAQCNNTEGSFTCSCHPGYTGDGTECSVALTVVLLFTGVLTFIAVVLMIIAILCGSICVVHQLRKMDAERSKIKLYISDDVVDLNFSPVSPLRTSKLKTAASIASVFDMLDIPDRQSQTSHTDSDSMLDTASTLDTESTLETESTLDTDGISDVLNTLLHHNSITTNVTPSVRMSAFLETDTDASLSPSSFTKHSDFNANVSCKAEVNGNHHLDPNITHPTAFSEDAHASTCTSTSKDRVHPAKEMQSSSVCVSDIVVSDVHNASHTSAVESFTGHSTGACKSAEQSGGYVNSLLQAGHGSPDMNSHIVELEPEFLQSMYLEKAVDQKSHSVNDMVEASKELQFSLGYVSDTHFLASVLEKPNVFELQGLEDSSNHSVVADDLSIGKMSPQLFSENCCATSDSTFGYFDNTTHSVSQVQHLSVNRGYITDCSKSGEEIPHTMQQMN